MLDVVNGSTSRRRLSSHRKSWNRIGRDQGSESSLGRSRLDLTQKDTSSLSALDLLQMAKPTKNKLAAILKGVNEVKADMLKQHAGKQAVAPLDQSVVEEINSSD